MKKMMKKRCKILAVSGTVFMAVLTVMLLFTENSKAEPLQAEEQIGINVNDVHAPEKCEIKEFTHEEIQEKIQAIMDIQYHEPESISVINASCEIDVPDSQYKNMEERIEKILSEADLSMKSSGENAAIGPYSEWAVTSANDMTGLLEQLQTLPVTNYASEETTADISALKNAALDDAAIAQLEQLYDCTSAEESYLLDDAIAAMKEHQSSLPYTEEAVSKITVSLFTCDEEE